MVRLYGIGKPDSRAFICRINEPSPIFRWKLISGFFGMCLNKKQVSPGKKAADRERNIGEGSLPRHMKARYSGFPMPYQRTLSDPPLESFLWFFRTCSIILRCSIKETTR